MSQIPKIEPVEKDQIVKKSLPVKDFEISSLEKNQRPLKKNSQESIYSTSKPINQVDNADNLYDKSLTDLQKNNIDSAIRGFQDYLKLDWCSQGFGFFV